MCVVGLVHSAEMRRGAAAPREEILVMQSSPVRGGFLVRPSRPRSFMSQESVSARPNFLLPCPVGEKRASRPFSEPQRHGTYPGASESGD